MTGRSRPTIGITKPSRGDNFAFLAIYAAVKRAGANVLKMTSDISWKSADINGLIIGGGSDVFPEHYGLSAIEGATYDQGRDEMEMYWARQARDRSIPTLGICRGAQIMNVAHGGSLHQDLKTIYEDVDYPSTLAGHAFFRKRIQIEPGSLLGRITDRDTMLVNSIHKQSIDRIGDGLNITASELNGVVQTIEDRTRDFYMGVQFHPEFLTYRSHFQRIFDRLVHSAKSYR